ncbi:MAG TPA: hypothetical protein VGD69_17775 [Herpetosiphonaceae bacterium]
MRDNNDPRGAEATPQPIDNQAVWKAVANAGINIRPHLVSPSRGWIASVNGRQLGPFATREEALGAAIHFLVERVQDAENQRQKNVSKTSGWDLVEVLFKGIFSFLS